MDGTKNATSAATSDVTRAAELPIPVFNATSSSPRSTSSPSALVPKHTKRSQCLPTIAGGRNGCRAFKLSRRSGSLASCSYSSTSKTIINPNSHFSILNSSSYPFHLGVKIIVTLKCHVHAHFSLPQHLKRVLFLKLFQAGNPIDHTQHRLLNVRISRRILPITSQNEWSFNPHATNFYGTGKMVTSAGTESVRPYVAQSSH